MPLRPAPVKRLSPPLRARRGFTLLEVLISLVVFSIGVIGLVKLQARASSAAVESEDRTRAALLAEDLISTMWLRGTSSLDSTTLSAWEARLTDTAALGLPGTPSYSVAASAGVTTVTITWQAPTRTDGAASAVQSRYATSVVIP